MVYPVLQSSLAAIALAGPLFALGVLIVGGVPPAQMPERRVHQVTAWTFGLGLVAALALGAGLALHGGAPLRIDLGTLITVRTYHFDVVLQIDASAIEFLVLDFLLCGIIGAFSARYLHQEPGFHGFYVLLVLFALGIELIAVSAGLDLLFAGWELVGLTSALLIAFFRRRDAPVRHGLRAYGVYKTTDVGLITALVLLHHATGSADFNAVSPAHLSATQSLLIGAMVVFGAMGKGAAVPFTGWLPRAMEGPTQSSAIFYGALSIHASPFLLLRAGALFTTHPELRWAIAAIGCATAVHARAVARVQTDVKTALGYSSVAQVGVIWMEVAAGFSTLAMAHIAGHAILRTWQLLRAPSLLHDRHLVSEMRGDGPPLVSSLLQRVLPLSAQRWWYHFSIERWFIDAWFDRLLLSPLNRALLWLDRVEHSVSEGMCLPTAGDELSAVARLNDDHVDTAAAPAAQLRSTDR